MRTEKTLKDRKSSLTAQVQTKLPLPVMILESLITIHDAASSTTRLQNKEIRHARQKG